MSSPIDNTWPHAPCANINTLEKRKFQEDANGDVCVNVCADIKTSVYQQNQTIKRIAIATANVEQSYVIPDNTKGYTIRNDGNGLMKWTFTATESGTQYRTLYPGELVEKSEVFLVSKSLYFQGSKAGDIIEIETWT